MKLKTLITLCIFLSAFALGTHTKNKRNTNTKWLFDNFFEWMKASFSLYCSTPDRKVETYKFSAEINSNDRGLYLTNQSNLKANQKFLDEFTNPFTVDGKNTIILDFGVLNCNFTEEEVGLFTGKTFKFSMKNFGDSPIRKSCGFKIVFPLGAGIFGNNPTGVIREVQRKCKKRKLELIQQKIAEEAEKERRQKLAKKFKEILEGYKKKAEELKKKQEAEAEAKRKKEEEENKALIAAALKLAKEQKDRKLKEIQEKEKIEKEKAEKERQRLEAERIKKEAEENQRLKLLEEESERQKQIEIAERKKQEEKKIEEDSKKNPEQQVIKPDKTNDSMTKESLMPTRKNLKVSYDPGAGNALYITGENKDLGKWGEEFYKRLSPSGYSTSKDNDLGSWEEGYKLDSKRGNSWELLDFSGSMVEGQKFKIVISKWVDDKKIKLSDSEQRLMLPVIETAFEFNANGEMIIKPKLKDRTRNRRRKTNK